MRYLFFMFFFFASLCYAEIYMQHDKDGNVIYSDVPLNSNAEKISISDTNIGMPFQKITSDSQLSATSSPVMISEHKPYITFAIESPRDQDTIQNQPSFTVVIKLQPALQKGDMIQLVIDGKLWSKPLTSTRLTINQLDRGTHQLYAVLIDRSRKVIKKPTLLPFLLNE